MGGFAISSGIGVATLTGIIEGITTVTGIGSGLFASAKIQEATGNGNLIKKMDMGFDTNVDKNKIKKFENECLEKVSNIPLMFSLKEELDKRNLHLTIEILHIALN